MKTKIAIIFILPLLILTGMVIAQEDKKADETKPQEENAIDNFSGLGFSTGIALTFYLGKDKAIDDAKLSNGIVRITKENNPNLRIMTETHYFFVLDNKCRWGVGPFVGVLSSGEQFLDAFALGGMIGLRRLGKNSSRSLNFGFGWVWDRNVKVLGAGIQANNPLPEGETEIFFKSKTLGGLLIIASFSWK